MSAVGLEAEATFDGASMTNTGTVVGTGGAMSLSGSDLVLNMANAGDGTNWGCQTTIGNIAFSTPKSFYKFYAEAQVLSNGGTFPEIQNACWGLAQAGADISGFDDGAHTNESGLLLVDASGAVSLNGTALFTIDAWHYNQAFAEMAVDIANMLAWVRVQGGEWNASGTADPGTGVGGVDISSLTGQIYIFGGMQAAFVGGPWQMEFNFGQSAFADTVPDGFNPGWGTPTVLISVLTWNGERIA